METKQKKARKRKVLTEPNYNSDSDFESDNSHIKFEPKITKPKQNITKSKKVKGNIEIKPTKVEEDRVELVWSCQTNNSNKTKFLKPNNFLNILHGYSSGIIKKSNFSKAATNPVIENVSKFGVSRLVTPFDRRVTALAWHPHHPSLAAAGSKGGDIILWDSNHDSSQSQNKNHFKSMIQGRGPGGSIQSLKFDNFHHERVYTASIDGTVTRHDFNGQDSKVYLETNDWEKWYTGLDISFSGRMIVAGNNRGIVTLLSIEGEKIWDLKLHKAKCNFVQFSERQPWMMVTTSTGAGTGSVKVWDIRNISGKQSALAELHHDKAVNSAYFSPVSGDKLLTTDQHSQLRVYQAPHFNLVKTIPHPHRQFQHLTAIKACWHPLADIPFAGRYPDPKFPGYEEGEMRSIDFFCPDTGDSLLQLHQPGLQQIISLSQFNPSGSCLLSGMGSSVLLWQARPEKQSEEDRRTVQTNMEGVSVQQWPDFKKKKKTQSKKIKSLTV